MASSSRKPTAKTPRAKKAVSKASAARRRSSAAKRTDKSAINEVIATELAPAVAIALLDKTEQSPGAPAPAPAPALDCLAAGAAPSETDGNVRVQLLFENGAALPVEMSVEAGAALLKGLSAEVKKSS